MYSAAIIDTDDECLKVMTGLLKRNHYITSVSCFNHSADYLSEMEKGHIRLAFIRIGNPDLQGISLAKKTLLISPDTRVIFISSNDSYAVMAFEEGAWGYLLLPAVQQELDSIIENIRLREIRKRGDSS